MKVNADVAEKRDGVGDGEAPQHTADDCAAAAPEVGLGDYRVGDVAARAAADENFRAETARAVEQDEGEV